MLLTAETVAFTDEQQQLGVGWTTTRSLLSASIVAASVPAFIMSLALSSIGRSVDYPVAPTPGAGITPMTGDGAVILTGPEIEPLWLALRRFQHATRAGDALIPFHATTNLPPAHIVESDAQPIQPHLEAIGWIKAATGLSQERIAELLGVSRQTLNRWGRGESIKDINRQRVFAVRGILERAFIKHPTRDQMQSWLDTPRQADAVTPAQLLAAGKLDRARLLAVTTPSPHVKRPPAWVRRPIPEAFRAGAEHMQEALPPEDYSLDIEFEE